jgi:PAS domain S-box-containing protein
VRLGYEVVGIADNAADALRLTQHTAPDLALLDIHIQGDIDGVGLAERIDVPVVFVTAHADSATLDRAKRTEPFGYVLKPFDERELQATLEIALGRHRAEMRLRRLDGWLATTLSCMDQGVVACDANLRVTFLNAAASELTGWGAAEALGCPLRNVLSLVFDHPNQTFEGMIRELLASAPRPKDNSSTTGARELRRRDGSTQPIEDTVSLVRDESGLSTGVVVLFRGRDEPVARSERPRFDQAQLIEAQRLEGLGLLAGGMAHQINNLLTAILSNTLLCGLEMNTTIGRESIEAIETAGRRAATLCNQVLTYAAQAPGDFQVLSLERVLEQSAALLVATLPKTTALSLQFDSDAALIRGDTVLLRQLLITVVVNASEALQGRNGRVEVRVKNAKLESTSPQPGVSQTLPAAGEHVCIEVTDTSQARESAADIPALEGYFQTKRSHGRALEAVRAIVGAHGGALSARRGASTSTLTIQFPAHRAEPRQGLAANARRVLVADDDRSVRLMLSRMLQGLGFDVEAVETGHDAVEAVARDPGRYSVVFLDLAMPRLGGVKAHEQIQMLAPTLPIALMSGYHETAARDVLGQGYTTFLQKPFTREDLNRKLQEALGAPG